MNKRVGYNVKLLVDKLFPCHVLKTIVTEHKSKEFYKEECAQYIAYPEIIRVKFVSTDCGTSQSLYSNEGEEAYAISKDVNPDDKFVHRINQMISISPEISMIDDTYCEMSHEFREWIYRYAVVDKLKDGETLLNVLSSISRVFNIDHVVEFDGCSCKCCKPSANERFKKWLRRLFK